MKIIQVFFLSVLCFTALAAGMVFMIHPLYPFGLSLSPLAYTPFENYFLPGLLLTMLVGGISLVALVLQLQQLKAAFPWTLLSAIISIVWLIIQMNLLREFQWIQWVLILIGFLLIMVSLQIKHRELI
jgi:hypothetical protein